MTDLRAYGAAAGPASMVLAIFVLAGGLLVLGGHRGGLALDAVELLWWPSVVFWAVAAVVAWRGGQGLWVATSAPLVIFPVAFYALLVLACRDGCDL